jgi:predicted transcriptional regulator
MRTTVRLRDDLLKRAKRRAAAEGRTLTSIIEEGVATDLQALMDDG